MENIATLQVSFSYLLSVGTHFNGSNLNSLSGIIVTPLYETSSISDDKSVTTTGVLVLCDTLICPFGIVLQKVLASG
jgi:hypothetical protein